MKSKDYNPQEQNATGCIIGEPNDVYHANAAISHSKLSDFIERPAKYYGRHITKELPGISTDALKMGNACHALILEGREVFERDFAVADLSLSWRSKADKLESCKVLNGYLLNPLADDDIAELATFKKEDIEAEFAQRPGRTLLTPEENQTVQKCYDSVYANPLARELLAEGLPEVVFRSEHKIENTFQVQCKCDWLNVASGLSEKACEILYADGLYYEQGMPYGVDLKTIYDMTQWSREFVNRSYYRAWPYYAKVMDLAVGKQVVEEWFWIAVEKQFPYSTLVRPPSPECWDVGLSDISIALPKLAECIRTNDWRDDACKKVTRQHLPDYKMNMETLTIGVK
jgi:hypothetical protein